MATSTTLDVMENGVDVSPEQDNDEIDGHIKPIIVKSSVQRLKTQVCINGKNSPDGKKHGKPIVDVTDSRQEEETPLETSRQSLHVRIITVGTPHPCHVAYMTSGTRVGPYLHVDSAGLLSCEAPESESSDIFTAEPFVGTDTGPKPFSLEVFCVRLYTQRNGSKWFLCYDNDYDVMCKLHDDDAIGTEKIDVRCFIKRMFGHKHLFQSATDRDLFIRYDSKTKTFKMKHIDAKYLFRLAHRDEDSIAKFHGCWFQIIDTEDCTESYSRVGCLGPVP